MNGEDCPPIGAGVVPLVEDDLRGEVLGCAAEGPRFGEHLPGKGVNGNCEGTGVKREV